jgi:hypothetical protein
LAEYLAQGAEKPYEMINENEKVSAVAS